MVARGQLGGGRWPSMEDDLRWKTTFDGRWPYMEDDTDTDTDTNTDGGGRLLVKFPFKRVFPTAAVCAAVCRFWICLLKLSIFVIRKATVKNNGAKFFLRSIAAIKSPATSCNFWQHRRFDVTWQNKTTQTLTNKQTEIMNFWSQVSYGKKHIYQE